MANATVHQMTYLRDAKTSRGFYFDLELLIFVKMSLISFVTRSLFVKTWNIDQAVCAAGDLTEPEFVNV